eukprot:46887-Pyramimonas_sp.AAC.1
MAELAGRAGEQKMHLGAKEIYRGSATVGAEHDDSAILPAEEGLYMRATIGHSRDGPHVVDHGEGLLAARRIIRGGTAEANQNRDASSNIGALTRQVATAFRAESERTRKSLH